MITAEEAKHIILQNTQDFGVEEIPFLESVGRVLKEDIVADRDFPPFNRVAMDGIAINYRFFQYGVRDFKIEGIQPAGATQETMENAAHCYEVMTGAMLPNNCDTVIRYEDVSIHTLMATVTVDEIKEGQNIHLQGTDRKQNDILIKKDTIISPAEIGVLATVGKSRVKVAKLPKVMIVSTGDELVNVDETPEAHQIRRSNVFTLVSLLNELKIPSETAHLTDEKEVLQQKIASFLNDYDVLLFSGAVSKGKFDFLPEVLEELGVKKLFHRVSQRPGKPFWMGIADAGISEQGRKTSKESVVERSRSDNHPKITLEKVSSTTLRHQKKLVFAFPGNPVSTFVNCLVYFYTWYYKSSGVEQQVQTATLTEDVSFKPDLTYFLQVKLTTKNGQIFATPIKGNGSGDLASLVEADGFIELPKTEETEFKKGAIYPVIRYRKFI